MSDPNNPWPPAPPTGTAGSPWGQQQPNTQAGWPSQPGMQPGMQPGLQQGTQAGMMPSHPGMQSQPGIAPSMPQAMAPVAQSALPQAHAKPHENPMKKTFFWIGVVTAGLGTIMAIISSDSMRGTGSFSAVALAIASLGFFKASELAP